MNTIYTICPIDKANCTFPKPTWESLVQQIAQAEQICFPHPWSHQAIVQTLCNDSTVFLAVIWPHACTKQDTVIGYGSFQHVCAEGYINNIAILPQWRQKGIGTALLDALKQQAGLLALSFLSLEVRQSNLAAVNLYQKSGFDICGRRKNFYTGPVEDGLIMTCFFDKSPQTE